MSNVIVVVGPGQIGQAIARRVGVGKHVLLADMREENANAAAEVLGNAGYQVSVATVDVSSREAVRALVETATGLGEVVGLIHAAGVSPSQASPSTILKVDLYGTALVLEELVFAPASRLDREQHLLDTLAAPSARTDPESQLLVREQLIAVLRAMASLTPRERTAIVNTIDLKSDYCLAPVLGCTPKAASNVACRARRKLADALPRAA